MLVIFSASDTQKKKIHHAQQQYARDAVVVVVWQTERQSALETSDADATASSNEKTSDFVFFIGRFDSVDVVSFPSTTDGGGSSTHHRDGKESENGFGGASFGGGSDQDWENRTRSHQL